MSILNYNSLQVTTILRTEITNLVGNDFIKKIGRKSLKNTLHTAINLWIQIFSAFLIGIYILNSNFSIFTFFIFPLALFISTRINALNVQVHEGSHYCLCQNKSLNELLSNWLFGFFIGIDVSTYRSTHFPHHKYLNDPNDPDLNLYSYDASKKKLIKFFIYDLIGITAFKRLLKYAENQPKNDYKIFLKKVICNFAILAFFILNVGLIKGFIGYFTFWFIPLISFFPLIIRIRTISEHCSYKQFKIQKLNSFVSRTTRCNPFERFLLGAQMEYHFEHHVFPNLPYLGQKKLHEKLWYSNFFEEFQINNKESPLISKGYLKSTKDLVKKII